MGHHALNGCRIEKGYRHWGHDLGPDITPLEAGLGLRHRLVERAFIGKAALLRRRPTGCERRMMLLDVSGHPLILHDEPILRKAS